MRKKNEYVVGFDNDSDSVYGKPEKSLIEEDKETWANPMTLLQAKKKLKEFDYRANLADRTDAVIYKLVRVRV